jgi:hypothetical protein
MTYVGHTFRFSHPTMHHRHLVASGGELLDDGASDEARAAEDEDAHRA